jgi:hypothetical protein
VTNSRAGLTDSTTTGTGLPDLHILSHRHRVSAALTRRLGYDAPLALPFCTVNREGILALLQLEDTLADGALAYLEHLRHALGRSLVQQLISQLLIDQRFPAGRV